MAYFHSDKFIPQLSINKKCPHDRLYTAQFPKQVWRQGVNEKSGPGSSQENPGSHVGSTITDRFSSSIKSSLLFCLPSCFLLLSNPGSSKDLKRWCCCCWFEFCCWTRWEEEEEEECKGWWVLSKERRCPSQTTKEPKRNSKGPRTCAGQSLGHFQDLYVCI